MNHNSLFADIEGFTDTQSDKENNTDFREDLIAVDHPNGNTGNMELFQSLINKLCEVFVERTRSLGENSLVGQPRA